MTKPIAKVTIPPDAGRAWWQVPDGLWRKWPRLQRIRLRAVVASLVLPLLRQLEQRQRPDAGKKNAVLARPLAALEKDPVAIELAITLFDLAQKEGLVGLGKGRQPPGACGLSVAQARSFYLYRAAGLILKLAGHKSDKLAEYVEPEDLNSVAALRSLQAVVGFDPLTVSELREGLRGDFPRLFDKDEAFLDTLRKVRPIEFLRALRYALGREFSRILDWSPEFIEALAEGLDHNAKILAAGASITCIEDPAVFRALGKWPMKEVKEGPGKGRKGRKGGKGGKGKKYITRIAQVKAVMGTDFETLLAGGPEAVALVGTLTNEQLQQLRSFVSFLSPRLLQIMAKLPFPQQVGILDGLWAHLGKDFMANELPTEGGAQVVARIIEDLDEMAARGSVPKDLKAMIKNGFFDKHMGPYMR